MCGRWRSLRGEDLFAARCCGVELVGVGRGLERIDVERESVELLVAVAASDGDGISGVGQFLEVGNVGGNEAVEAGESVRALVEGGVAHEIDDGVLLLQAGAIEIVTVRDADQVGHLNGLEKTCAMAGDDAGRNRSHQGANLLVGERLHRDPWDRGYPGHAKERLPRTGNGKEPLRQRSAEGKFPCAPLRTTPPGITRVWHMPQANEPSSTFPFSRMT